MCSAVESIVKAPGKLYGTFNMLDRSFDEVTILKTEPGKRNIHLDGIS